MPSTTLIVINLIGVLSWPYFKAWLCLRELKYIQREAQQMNLLHHIPNAWGGYWDVFRRVRYFAPIQPPIKCRYYVWYKLGHWEVLQYDR